MPFITLRLSTRRTPAVRRELLIILLLILPLAACGGRKSRKALEKNRYFAEIVKREDARRIGDDAFFRDNLLGNRDPEVQGWCAIALGRIADPRALPLLYGALHGEDSGVRAAAAFAIGEMEDRELVDARCSSADPRAVLELFRLLDDPSISVRMRAIEALGKIGSRSDTADILRRLEHTTCCVSAFDRAFLGTAIAALARLKDPSAIPFLEQLNSIRDPEIQRSAMEARTHIRSEADAARSANTPAKPGVAPVAPCGAKAQAEPAPGTGYVTDAVAIALAASRKNSTIARIETTRGTIEIELFREQAPVTVEQFVSMARRGVFDGTGFTKSSTSGTIEGGNPVEWPGLRRTVHSEVNMRPFERGRVGMAVSGGSSDAGRFFITLEPQPYLDGINTCFGHVMSGMQIVDRLAPGDRIRRITIKEKIHFHDYQRY